jgi:hypothetical protein
MMNAKPIGGARAGAEDPAPALTYGACKVKLRELGYAPVPALLPFGSVADVPGQPVELARTSDCFLSEYPVAVNTVRGAVNLLGLIVFAGEKSAVIQQLLAEHQLAGPRRTGSDGVTIHVLRWTQHAPPSMPWRFPREFIALHHGMGGNAPMATIPLDGEWNGGTLLEVAAADLPAINEAILDGFLAALHPVVNPAPPLKRPGKLGFIGRT